MACYTNVRRSRTWIIAACSLALVVSLVTMSSAHAADAPKVSTSVEVVTGPITVAPTSLELKHVRRPQSIQVLGATADGYSVDLHREAKFTSGDEKIAVVDTAGWVRPVASGTTEITIDVAGRTMKVPVKADLPAPDPKFAEPKYSFRHEVMAVLTKGGCNMGACHGYSLGKNGFKLSLRGADPELDYPAIVREMYGRRVDFAKPDLSLLVSKPRGDVVHEGGVRFARGSLQDDILRKWCEQGAPSDLDDPRRVVRVSLTPEKLVLKPGKPHRLQLTAHYDDGSTRDVTRLGSYTVNNPQFAAVDEEGGIIAGEAGETAIVARFERVFAATGLIVLAPTQNFTLTPLPPVSPQGDDLIDRAIVEKLNRLRITPSPVAGDEEFLRRVYLDLIGIQPKPDEIKTFLADASPKKREAVIDALLERPEFVDQWSLKWGDLLQNSRNSVSSNSVFLFREFIRSAVASNMPLDEFVRRILTSRGGAIDDPASTYFAISKDLNDTVERSTQVFCGVRMLCTRCHSHPMENWTQADYFGLGSFFSQVSTRADVRYPGIQNAKLVQVNLAVGSATNPRTGKPQPPRYLGGAEPELPADVDRREAYAKWLTSPDNTFFARGMVNRIWSYFFHRGIVDPVDDVRSTNPPINPVLLDALTADFIAHKFDVKHLMRRIVTSATYQRTSLANDSNRHDEQNFSHAVPRRIPAEALLDSLVQATNVPEPFGGAPAGFRAAQLPDAVVTSPFLNLFGKPQRMDACECERDNGSNMLQALHLINGKGILSRVENPSGRVAQLTAQLKNDDELVAELYLWSLARRPTAEETQAGADFLKSNGAKRQEAAQDLMWALLNTKDFLLVR
jgi:hypothetical protein